MASSSTGDGVPTVSTTSPSGRVGGGGMVTVKKTMKRDRGSTAKERISKMPPCTVGKRSSIYRGVTRHRWTGRYEAHLWDKSTWNQNQNKKGKQVYLGAYDDEEAAARAYDLAALKYWGPPTLINFPVTDYSRDIEEMQNLSREEYLASLRRKSSGFSRGIAKYRALSSGRWEALLGRTAGTNYLHSIHYGKGEDVPMEGECPSRFGTERKIDLSGHINWWEGIKIRQPEVVKHISPEEASSELKSLEHATQPTDPYQMPLLGTSYETHKSKRSVSALSILSRSAAYKNMQEKASKIKENVNKNENDENENKSNISRINLGKAVEKASDDTGIKRIESTTGLAAPLLINYNAIDPLADPILWTSLTPVFPPAPSRTAEVTKTESSSTYDLYGHEER